MPTKPKIVLNFDPDESVGKFCAWYEVKYTTTNENGRKRKGNAKKAIKDFFNAYIDKAGVVSIDDILKVTGGFLEALKEYNETGKLPNELKDAKMYLSEEDFKSFEENWYKINRARNAEIMEENKEHADKLKKYADKKNLPDEEKDSSES